MKQLLKYIPIENAELNNQVYAGAKVVSEKHGIQIRNPKRNRETKTGWKMKSEEQIKREKKDIYKKPKKKKKKYKKTQNKTNYADM